MFSSSAYQLFNTSASTAKMVQKGLKAHIGAHGEPPLGLNYHAEMFFARKGGLTNYETIRAATSDAAATLGLSDAIGSLAAGKLGDFIMYHPDVALLEGDIEESTRIKYVVRGGRMWNARNLEEVWPVKGRRPVMPTVNAE
jgi:imidazolonepropionase-like amidohydrolase